MTLWAYYNIDIDILLAPPSLLPIDQALEDYRGKPALPPGESNDARLRVKLGR